MHFPLTVAGLTLYIVNYYSQREGYERQKDRNAD
jgi:hypothetical protein